MTDTVDIPEPRLGRDLSGVGWLCLAGVLLVCLAVRLLLIASTDTIANDGILYIRMAKEWSASPAGVVERYDYPPGYPVALLGVHRALVAVGIPDDLGSWERAGRIVSLIASLAALAGIWLFAAAAFDWRVACLTVLLFGVARKWTVLGMDVLSDALAVAFQVWAVVLALATARLLRQRSRWSLAAAAGVGGCAGLGYLVRPEALLVVGLAGLLWLVDRFRRRNQWRQVIPAALLMASVTTLLALPYILAAGRWTKKNIPVPVSVSGAPVEPSTAPAPENPPEPVAEPSRPLPRGEVKLLGQLTEAMHPVLVALVAVFLGRWFWLHVLRRKSRDGLSLEVRAGPAILMIAGSLAIGAMLLGLYSRVGYMSHRHATFLAALLCPLAGAGVLVMARWLRLLVARLHGPPAAGGAAAACLVAGLTGGLLLHAARSAHPGDSVFREAGAWIAASAAPGERVVADNPLVLHYAQRGGAVLSDQDLTAKKVAAALHRRASPGVWLALTDRNLQERPTLVEWLLASGPPEVVCLGNRSKEAVRIFRSDRGTGSKAGGGRP